MENVSLKKHAEEIKAELTPSLERCIKAYMGEPVVSPLANSRYFFENTFLKGPLELFIQRVIEGLYRKGPTVLPLRIGFGFGKTHAEILLLHAFLSPNEIPAEVKDRMKVLGYSEDLVAKTLVLPIDFFSLAFSPFSILNEILKAYTSPDTRFFKSKLIADKINEHIGSLIYTDHLDSISFANLIAKIAKEAELNILILIDEFGLGFLKRVEKYLEDKSYGQIPSEALLAQATWLASCLTTLAEISNREEISCVIVYAFAEQDFESLGIYAAKDPTIEKFSGIVEYELSQRLNRYTGGIMESALGFSLDDMVDVALFRILNIPEGIKEKVADTLGNIGVAYGVLNPGEKGDFVKAAERYFPISPSLTNALKKFAKRDEIPGAEHVRSAIYALALAAERSLYYDPYTPLIDVKHLSIEEACFLGQMGDIRQDWAAMLSDLVDTINKADPKLKGLCEHIAKQIIAKAATAATLELARAQDLKSAIKYGTTLKELQLSLICTTPSDRIGETLDLSKEALTYLLSRSASFEERIVEGETFYFPAIMGTVFNRLPLYLADERKAAFADSFNYLSSSFLISSIFAEMRAEGSIIRRVELEMLRDSAKLSSVLGKYLKEPQPVLAFVEPWDSGLVFEVKNQGGYTALILLLIKEMNAEEYVEKMGHPFYLIAFVPNIDETMLKPLLEPLMEYEAAKKFLSYLADEEGVRREIMEKALASAGIKRAKLFPREIQKVIEQKVRLEIGAAEGAAQSMMLRAARETVAKLIGLYKQIIAYDLSQKSFTLVDTSKQFGEVSGALGELKDPSKCADIIGSFLFNILKSRYVESVNKLEEVLSEDLKNRINQGMLGSLKVNDLVESFTQGSYDVIPLNSNLAKTAIQRLSGISSDLPDKTVTTLLEDEEIRFQEFPKAPPPGPPPKPSPIPTAEKLADICLSNLTREEMLTFAGMIKDRFKSTEVRIGLKGEKIEASLTIKEDFEPILVVFNAIATIASKYKSATKIQVIFSEEMTREEINNILGALSSKMEKEGG